jgi:protein-tyrosine phosphatase
VSQDEGFVDLHCHLLPQLDDGPETWEESLALARRAVAEGIRTVVATPHQHEIFPDNDAPRIRRQTERLQDVLEQHGVPLEVLPGAEVRITADVLARIRGGEALTLADRGRHVLLELPHEVYLPIERLLADLKAAGIAAVLAHPERNRGILRSPGLVGTLLADGCLLQVTAGSLLGRHGSRVQALAEALVQRGCVHFIASDAHNLEDRPPALQQAMRRVENLAGQEYAREVFWGNPLRVVEGKTVRPGSREVAPPGWRIPWPWRKAG